MHNASTKQRIAALRRRLGIFTGWQPRWVKERRKRLERLAASTDGATTPPLAAATATAVDGPWSADATAAYAAEQGATALVTDGLDASAPDPSRVAAPEAPTEVVARSEVATVRTSVAGNGILARPAGGRSGGRHRGAIAAAVLVAVVAAIFAVTRRASAPAAEAVGPPATGELERSAGRDALVRVAVPAAAALSPAAPASAAGATALEVRPGDTLWHLAAVHLGDPMRWPELHAANARQIDDPDLIYPGQRLRVPGIERL